MNINTLQKSQKLALARFGFSLALAVAWSASKTQLRIDSITGLGEVGGGVEIDWFRGFGIFPQGGGPGELNIEVHKKRRDVEAGGVRLNLPLHSGQGVKIHAYHHKSCIIFIFLSIVLHLPSSSMTESSSSLP